MVNSHLRNMKKTILKTGYYYEFKDIYDSLPDELPVPTDYVEIINKETRTEKQMIEGQEFLSKEEAFGLVCKIITDNNIEEYTPQIIFFNYEGGICKVRVYLVSDGWRVYTHGFGTSHRWYAGDRSFFRRPSGTLSTQTLGNLEPLTFNQAVKLIKDAGYKITREKTIIEEL